MAKTGTVDDIDLRGRAEGLEDASRTAHYCEVRFLKAEGINETRAVVLPRRSW